MNFDDLWNQRDFFRFVENVCMRAKDAKKSTPANVFADRDWET